jgi:8-amino-7-oxononanoate synthase
MGLMSSAPTVMQSAVSAEIVLDGRRYINFGGSSYLGLAGNPDVVDAGVTALRQCGSGVPIPSFHGIATSSLREAELAGGAFFHSAAAVLLSGGYLFGLAAFAALRSRYDVVFFDEWAHYTLLDGIAASGLRSYSFRHLDTEDLASKLKQHMRPKERPLLATDGLYSTFGEIAPLGTWAKVIAGYGGRFVIDESHSFGVIGPTGRGVLEHHGMPTEMALVGGSLGKAFGTCGGIAPCSTEDATAVRATRVACGASTGLPAAAAMCAKSMRYVNEHPELLQRLRSNTAYLKAGLRRIGLEISGDEPAPIAAFTAAGRSAEAVKAALMDNGIYVYHSTYIGAGTAGVLRCGVFADHTQDHLDALLHALTRLL